MSSSSLKVDIQIHGALPVNWSAARVKSITRSVLKELKIKQAEIGLALLTQQKMSVMNKTYHKTNGATDVLSFGYGDARKTKNMIGDILICTVFARNQARARKIDFTEEMSRLLIHGLLHLSGMDHATLRTEKVMFALQERLLKKV